MFYYINKNIYKYIIINENLYMKSLLKNFFIKGHSLIILIEVPS
jgi:hypothetical protein